MLIREMLCAFVGVVGLAWFIFAICCSPPVKDHALELIIVVTCTFGVVWIIQFSRYVPTPPIEQYNTVVQLDDLRKYYKDNDKGMLTNFTLAFEYPFVFRVVVLIGSLTVQKEAVECDDKCVCPILDANSTIMAWAVCDGTCPSCTTIWEAALNSSYFDNPSFQVTKCNIDNQTNGKHAMTVEFLPEEVAYLEAAYNVKSKIFILTTILFTLYFISCCTVLCKQQKWEQEQKVSPMVTKDVAVDLT